MDIQGAFKYFLIFVISTFFIYVITTNRNIIVLQPFSISPISFNTERTVVLFNHSNETINNDSSELFHSRLSDHIPHLPIHIFTHNESPNTDKSKLILLGNGFFGDRGWGITGPGKTSTQIMTELSCPFLSNYCDITTDTSRFSQADAVVYHLRDAVDKEFAEKNRSPNQRFIFALWESPAHSPSLGSYKKFFNWTMSYRFQSDIITSYYSGNAYVHKSSPFYRRLLNESEIRKIKLNVRSVDDRPSNETLAKKKLGLAAALISNCGGTSKRLAYINELRQHIHVQIYGRCGIRCPPNVNCRQFIAENYYFVLSFENSLCSEYATEKFFAPLEYPIVPVVLGRTNYSYFIPSSGFIDASQFPTVSALAQFLKKTHQDQEKYLSYFSWKKDVVWGLLNFFTPFCDLCLRLHLDTQPKVIDNLQSWWFDGMCKTATVPI